MNKLIYRTEVLNQRLIPKIPEDTGLYDAKDGGGRATQEAKAEHICFHPELRRLKRLLLVLGLRSRLDSTTCFHADVLLTGGGHARRCASL